MTTIIGRGVRVEVQKTLGTAKVISAITKANPGVASSTAHALTAGTVGFLSSVEGMVQLEGMAGRVAPSPGTDSFGLQSLNTTNFPDFSGSALFTPVTAWDTLGEATGFSIGGGEAEKLDDTALIHDVKQELPGLQAAQTVTININAQTVPSVAMATIEDAARDAADLVFRVTYKDGAVRCFRGSPSLPGEDVQKGALGTGSFSVTVKGFVIKAA